MQKSNDRLLAIDYQINCASPNTCTLLISLSRESQIMYTLALYNTIHYNTILDITLMETGSQKYMYENDLFALRFYNPVNPMGPCRVRSIYLNTRLLGRPSPLSG